jgi:hypothetical protein
MCDWTLIERGTSKTGQRSNLSLAELRQLNGLSQRAANEFELDGNIDGRRADWGNLINSNLSGLCWPLAFQRKRDQSIFHGHCVRLEEALA